jgi:hypothetical protein
MVIKYAMGEKEILVARKVIFLFKQCCGSGMFVYPGSRNLIFTHPGSWIPDPKTATKERGEK